MGLKIDVIGTNFQATAANIQYLSRTQCDITHSLAQLNKCVYENYTYAMSLHVFAGVTHCTVVSIHDPAHVQVHALGSLKHGIIMMLEATTRTAAQTSSLQNTLIIFWSPQLHSFVCVTHKIQGVLTIGISVLEKLPSYI